MNEETKYSTVGRVIRWHLGICLLFLAFGLRAQITESSGTEVTEIGNTFVISEGITSGSNLFHSFVEFGLSSDQTANFLTNANVDNILGRVTGGRASFINGEIQVTGGDSNLFLINPAGMVFGSGASLNLPASFAASTSDSVTFEGGGRWSVSNESSPYDALNSKPLSFEFTSGQSGSLINAGRIAVPGDHSISLTAGSVLNSGRLNGGSVTLTAVDRVATVKLRSPGSPLSIEFEVPQNATGDIPDINIIDLPELLAGAGEMIENDLTAGSVNPIWEGSVVTFGEVVTGNAGGDIVFHSTNDVHVNATVSTDGGGIYMEALNNLAANSDICTNDCVFRVEKDVGPAASGEVTLVAGDRLAISNAEVSTEGGEITLLARGQGATNATVAVLNSTLDSGAAGVSIQGNEVDLINSQVVSEARAEIQAYDNAVSLSVGGSLNDGRLNVNDRELAAFDTPELLIGSTSWASSTEVVSDLNVNYNLLLSGGGALNINGQITTNGNNLGLASGDGLFIFQDIDTGRGSLDITAPGDVGVCAAMSTDGGNLTVKGQFIGATDGSFNTSSPSSNGGELSLIATDGAIVLTDIDASGSLGGDITIEAHGPNGYLSLGRVESQGLRNEGGEVTLQSTGDISLAIVNSEGVTGGGDISIDTGQLFQGTDVFSSQRGAATISAGSTAGSTGTVEIRHGGGYGILPFVVGNSNINGTASDVISVSDIAASVQSIPYSYIEPTLSIIGEGNPNRLPPGSDIPTVPPPDATPVDRLAPVTEVETIHTNRVKSVFNIFGRGVSASEILDAERIRRKLKKAEIATGMKPAVIYSRFMPYQSDRPDDFGLQLILVTPEGLPLQIYQNETTRSVINAAMSGLEVAFKDKNSRQLCEKLTSSSDDGCEELQLYNWLVKPLIPSLRNHEIDHLILIGEGSLRLLPWAALHDGSTYLVEQFSLGVMPSFSLTDTEYVGMDDLELLAIGSNQFESRENNLIFPETEIAMLGSIWQRTSQPALTGDTFTFNNLKQRSSNATVRMLHVATHTNLSTTTPEIVMNGGKNLGTLGFREIGLHVPPKLELLTLSSCESATQTGIASGKSSIGQELGFAGFAAAAGVKSIVGSLWKVDDLGALALMSEFYGYLKQGKKKAEALRLAQMSMIKGDTKVDGKKLIGKSFLPIDIDQDVSDTTFEHPFYWSAFTLVGSPW